jgi:hypothetical protein
MWNWMQHVFVVVLSILALFFRQKVTPAFIESDKSQVHSVHALQAQAQYSEHHQTFLAGF